MNKNIIYVDFIFRKKKINFFNYYILSKTIFLVSYIKRFLKGNKYKNLEMETRKIL